MHVYHVCNWSFQRSEEDMRSSGTEVANGCEFPSIMSYSEAQRNGKKTSLTWEIHLKVNINRMSGVFPFSTNIYKRYSIVE